VREDELVICRMGQNNHVRIEPFWGGGRDDAVVALDEYEDLKTTMKTQVARPLGLRCIGLTRSRGGPKRT